VTSPSLKRTRRTLLSFTIVLMFFLIVSDALIITQQKKMFRDELTYHTQHEFELFSKLVSGSLTKGDYVSVQEAVLEWGKEQENLVELSIQTANGFVIADYKRDYPAETSEKIQTEISYGHNNRAALFLEKDMSELNRDINELAYQLVLFSVVLVSILGIVLQQIAVRPLQKEISEHENTLEKMEVQAKQLQESNKELESYSYSIAHDLRTPLRSIVSFCQIIRAEAGGKLTEEEIGYFDRVVNASKRMAELIDDILDLGRVTRKEMQLSSVDLTALAKAAIEKFCFSNGKNNVDINIQDNLTTVGDKRLLTLLMDNLVGNACKYSSMINKPSIEVGSTSLKSNGTQCSSFYVRDNGVGFSMKYADNLFKPFHRLHNDSEFEGNGIGLATAQRIVFRHGGRIWAEGEVNGGATFYFTLGN